MWTQKVIEMTSFFAVLHRACFLETWLPCCHGDPGSCNLRLASGTFCCCRKRLQVRPQAGGDEGAPHRTHPQKTHSLTENTHTHRKHPHTLTGHTHRKHTLSQKTNTLTENTHTVTENTHTLTKNTHTLTEKQQTLIVHSVCATHIGCQLALKSFKNEFVNEIPGCIDHTI